MAFGQGARTCIGKNISLLEMSKLLPEVIRRFDFELNETAKWDSVTHCFTNPKQVECGLRRRQDVY